MKILSLWLIILGAVSSSSFGWTHLAGNTFGWKQRKLTVYVNTANCTLPDAEIYSIIDAALGAWNGISTTDLELVRSPVPASDGEAQFRAGTATQVPLVVCSTHLMDYSQDPNSILAFMPYSRIDSDGYVNYSGLVLNAEVGSAAELSLLSQSEVEVVVGHELGHVLGLGHSGDPDALMYFQLNKSFLLITQDDIDGVTHLYPRSEFSGGAFGCAAAHHAQTTIPFAGTLMMVLVCLLIVLLGRRFFNIERLPEFPE